MGLGILEEYIENGDAIAIDNLLHNTPSLATQKTSHGISPLLLACYYNKPKLAKIILGHLENVDIFEAAAIGLLEETIKILEERPDAINQFSDHGFTALALATHFGNEDIVRHFLKSGADPNLESENGYHVYPLHTAVSSGFEGIAKMLIEAGAEVNVLQSSNMTPLHYAAEKGNIELLIILLEGGASVATKNDSGKTAADLAAERGHHEIAQILKV